MQNITENISKNSIHDDEVSTIYVDVNSDNENEAVASKEQQTSNNTTTKSYSPNQKLNSDLNSSIFADKAKTGEAALENEKQTNVSASNDLKEPLGTNEGTIGAEKAESTKDSAKPKIKAKKEKKPQEKAGKRFHSWLKEKFCSETEVVGVEVQPDIIRICQAKNDGKKWSIEKLFSAETLNAHDYESLKKNKEVYSKSLKAAFKKNKILNKNVALSIPASLTIIRTISLPLMTRENLAKATKIQSFWQNLVQLSGDIKDYSIFYKIVSESAEKKEMDVLFSACKKDDLNTYIEIFEGAGLTPVVIDVACFSINNLSKLKESDTNEQRVFLKIGKDENYLQVIDDGKPHIYDIFVPENEKSYMNEYLDHQTFQQRFSSQINHAISKHEDKFSKKIDKISIISSEKNIKGFIDSLNESVKGVEIKLSDLFENIELSDYILHNEEFNLNPTAWAIPAGLATREIDIFSAEDKQSVSEAVNLLPQAGNIKSNLRSGFYSKIISWGVLIFCLLVVLAYGAFSYSMYNSKVVAINEFNKLAEEYKSKNLVFNNITSLSGKLNKLIKARESINSNQTQLLNALDNISSSIPEGVWLREIKMLDDSSLSIIGQSYEEKNIIKFSRNLELTDKVEGVNIRNMRSQYLQSGALIKEFVISADILK